MAKNVEYIEQLDVDEAIDQVGFGRPHVVLYLIVGLFTAADSVEVAFLSFVTEALKEPWGLTSSDEATMEAVVFAGQILGAPCWGKLADAYGRRPVFLVSAALISSFGILTAFAQNTSQLIMIRFVVGVGVAGLSVPFDIFAEALPTEYRGKLLMSTFYWFAIGSFYTTFAAWLTLCDYGWRWFTIMAAIPTTVASIMGIFLLPESAHWLASEGKFDKAAGVVNKIARRIGVPLEFGALSVPPLEERIRTRDLLTHSKLRKPFFSMAFVWFGFGIGFYGISFLLPHLFANTTPAAKTTECATFDFLDIAKGQFGQVLGLTIGMLFIDRWGRKPVQYISYLVAAIMTLGLGFPKTFGPSALSIISAVALSGQMAASCCTWTHTPELFPTKVRGTANALCNSCARFGAAISPYIVHNCGDLWTALILSGACVASAIGVSLVKETAGHKIVDKNKDEHATCTKEIAI